MQIFKDQIAHQCKREEKLDQGRRGWAFSPPGARAGREDAHFLLAWPRRVMGGCLAPNCAPTTPSPRLRGLFRGDVICGFSPAHLQQGVGVLLGLQPLSLRSLPSSTQKCFDANARAACVFCVRIYVIYVKSERNKWSLEPQSKDESATLPNLKSCCYSSDFITTPGRHVNLYVATALDSKNANRGVFLSWKRFLVSKYLKFRAKKPFFCFPTCFHQTKTLQYMYILV